MQGVSNKATSNVWAQWIALLLTVFMSATSLAYSVGILTSKVNRNTQDVRELQNKYVTAEVLTAKIDGIQQELNDIRTDLQQQHADLIKVLRK